MKIKTGEKTIEEVLKITPFPHKDPVKQTLLFRTLILLVSLPELRKVHFKYTVEGMEQIPEGQPCLYLMNHSCSVDLKMAAKMLYPKPFHIICTSDGFVGKEGLMRRIGCIPTQKFTTDLNMIRDMKYAFHELHESVLLYPEASYTFDGTATPLPESLGKCIKMMDVPVVMIRTDGAFLRDPLYNELQLRDAEVSAKMSLMFSREQIEKASVGEINEKLKEAFTFDHFRSQKERGILVKEKFRADGLERVLYKCPVCGAEGRNTGKGTGLVCASCGNTIEMEEDGSLTWKTDSGNTEPITHVPDWYAWEREQVRRELEEGTYRTEIPVDIYMLADYSAVYHVGEGILEHSDEGFHLTGCGGKLDYSQKPLAAYSLYADYFWYEIGDMVCIGNAKLLYYCFPKDPAFPVAKLRLAAEELYKIKKSGKKVR